MDQLEIQGKIYISSKRAAEITGYAKDYVGQLARENKVPGTRVGRAWYVGLDAIKTHAGIAEANPSHGDLSTALEKSLEIKEARERLRSLNSIRFAGANQQLLTTWSEFKYLSDNSDLFPTVEKNLVEPRNYVIPIKKVDSISDQINKSDKIAKSEDQENTKIEKIHLQDIISTSQNGENKVYSKKSPLTGLIAGSTALALFALIILPFASSFYFQWNFINSPAVASASTTSFQVEFELIFDYFKVIFDSGVGLVQNFLDLMLNSIAEFFDSGLNFLIDLLNLE